MLTKSFSSAFKPPSHSTQLHSSHGQLSCVLPHTASSNQSAQLSYASPSSTPTIRFSTKSNQIKSSNNQPMAESSQKSNLTRSLTMRSSSKRDSSQKPYLYQPIDRSNSVKKFFNPTGDGHSFHSKVNELCRLFESQNISSKSILSDSAASGRAFRVRLPGGEDKVVVYFTSLRGVRRTYEDCYAVRMIFRGLGVDVDERDVLMDSGFRRELQRVMKEKAVSLPQVFVNGRYVGGAEETRRLFENGELVKMVEGMPLKAAGYVCQSCGDVRFVPCLNCDGSKKVFDEYEEVVHRCRVCNENGLIRCPSCCT